MEILPVFDPTIFNDSIYYYFIINLSTDSDQIKLCFKHKKHMKYLFSITLALFFFVSAFGQCDTKFTSKSSVARFVNGDAKQNEMPIEATIAIDRGQIILNLSIGGKSATIINTIKEIEKCEWKEFLKNGQAIYKVTTDKGDGYPEDSIVKITGRDGKATIYFGSDPDDKGGLELDMAEIKVED